MFRSIHDDLQRSLAAEFEEVDLRDALQSDKLSPALLEAVLESAVGLASTLKKRSAGMLRDRRWRNFGFRRRNMRRWRPAFDQIEIVWHVAEEIGREFNDEFRADAAASSDYVFDVLSRLHGRGLLVAAEAIHLMKGGYADGALARWRTLHEILVVAMFVRDAGQLIAERYLASVDFSRKQAAEQLNRYAARANLTPFSPAELKAFNDRCLDLATKYGPEFLDKQGYGWAFPYFAAKSPNIHVKFDNIEEAIGLDHWRPRYKWASQHTHAGHRHSRAYLAMSESDSDLILVGESNSGFVDPLQMTALHVSSLTTVLLMTRPTLDTQIMAECLAVLAKEVANIAIEAERTSAERHARKSRQR